MPYSIHRLRWSVGQTLALGFLLVILLGLLGYAATLQAVRLSTARERRLESQVHTAVSLAKDASLHSHDTEFYSQAYVYTGNSGNRDRKWEAEEAANTSFDALAAILAGLPGGDALRGQVEDARTQNVRACEPIESRAIRLAEAGQRQPARALLEGSGTAARYALELKLESLVTDLGSYSKAASRAEARQTARTIALGWIVQGLILALSTGIALIVTRLITRSVRESIRARDDLRESEARYRLLFESSPHPMFVYDRDSLRYLAVNGATVQHYGYSRAEFLAMTLLDIRPPEDAERLRRDVTGQGPGSTATDRVWRHLRRDGSLIWVEITSQSLTWAGHTAAIVIAQDITTRRQAEEGLNRLAAIVHSSHDAIIGWAADGTIRSWNPGAARLYGWTEDEMCGRPIEILLPPECEEEGEQISDALLAGRSIEIADTTRLRRDGSEVAVSVSSSPVRDASGEIIGASTIARDITAQKQAQMAQEQAQQTIRRQAEHDSLTGLPNRARFHAALGEALANGKPLAVLFVDLDMFKRVNDSLGHAAGDHLLREVAARFQTCLGPQDLLARMGGDEFTLLLHPPQADGRSGKALKETAEETAQHLLNALAQPVFVGGHSLHVAASIGISLAPQDGRDAETLIKHADLAMYRAKDEGRNCWHLFTAALIEAAHEKLTLENSLRHAIRAGELTVFYQPQVSLRTGSVLGVEALVRWQHPQWGMVSPGRFIPLAEESGLILPLGRWVLREACRQAARWARSGEIRRVSVNLSARQLGEPGLVAQVRDILEETGLPPACLDLELTESALIAQGEAVSARLSALRALGVRIAVDDFGTGYSSLAYLRRFPLDILKVDRSFISGLAEPGAEGRRNQAVVRAVVDMAHALSLEVIAEGVETEEQRTIMAALGCDEMQGFLFSPPVPPARLEELLAEELLARAELPQRARPRLLAAA